MKRRSILHAAVFAATALALAACGSSHRQEAMLDPLVAQHLVAARADPDLALDEKVKSALGLDAGQGVYGVEVTAAGVVGVRALVDHIQVDPGA